MMGWGWYGDGPGWVGWLAMSLTMLALWALLVFGVIAVWRALSRDDRHAEQQRRSAEQLLEERFARGEIDVQEYRERREVLRSAR